MGEWTPGWPISSLYFVIFSECSTRNWAFVTIRKNIVYEVSFLSLCALSVDALAGRVGLEVQGSEKRMKGVERPQVYLLSLSICHVQALRWVDCHSWGRAQTTRHCWADETREWCVQRPWGVKQQARRTANSSEGLWGRGWPGDGWAGCSLSAVPKGADCVLGALGLLCGCFSFFKWKFLLRSITLKETRYVITIWKYISGTNFLKRLPKCAANGCLWLGIKFPRKASETDFKGCCISKNSDVAMRSLESCAEKFRRCLW